MFFNTNELTFSFPFEAKMNVNSSQTEADDRLISLIDFEIERLDRSEKKPGWSKWAILGGIASCLWLLSSQIEIYNIDWNTSLFIFLSFGLFREFFTFLRLIINPLSSDSKNVRFYIARQYAGQFRDTALFVIFRYSLFFYLIITFKNKFYPISFYSVCVFISGMLLLVLLTFILSYFDMPVSSTGNKKGDIFLAGILAFFSSY